jgi:hypothetical protein
LGASGTGTSAVGSGVIIFSSDIIILIRFC